MRDLHTRVAGRMGIAWPAVEGTVAATLAWVIAKHLIEHHQPFFAPIAAVIALNAPLGERGRNAFRLVVGVVVGIVAAEVAIAVLGDGYLTLAVATFAAMAVALSLGRIPIVIAQSAVSAILTVAVANGQVGFNRLEDALIGAGVALVFSQLLFSPEPLRLLRRAETGALATMADALELTAQALERDDHALAEEARNKLRDLRDRLAELARTRTASQRVAQRAPVWRAQLPPVVEENEDAGQLDLLGGSCITLNRTAMGIDASSRREVAPSVVALAGALREMHEDLADRDRRQRAADGALDVARQIAASAPTGRALAAAETAVQMVAGDIMVFAGVRPEDADRAVSAGTGELRVPPPARPPRRPLSIPSRWRWGGRGA